MPLVSIVIPTYNGARFIRETIDSLLNQTFMDLEIIVVIDGSTDETEDILATYKEPRMHTIRTENQGQAMAMNTGFAAAQGEYLSWSSDDNVYMPDAFQVMVEYLNAHPEAPAVSTDCLIMNGKGRVTSYKEFEWQCFLYRSAVAQRVGRHRPEARILEDIDFYLRLQHEAGPVHRISRPYMKYRIHPHMVSSTKRHERQLISVKINYDHIVRGVSSEDMKTMFLSRLARCALYNDHESMDKILTFAQEKGIRFLPELEARVAFLKSPTGWLVNRLNIALRSKLGALNDRLKLYRYRVQLLLGAK